MTNESRSLLAYLDAPVLVGDPQGCTVYVNPAFETGFGWTGDQARGVPLAQLFEGGGREAVLGAAAKACREGGSVRFRMRERGVGFAAVASPIVADGQSIGVVVLFTEEVEEIERLFQLHRQLAGAIDDYAKLVADDADPAWRGTNRDVEERKHAFERIRQYSEGLRRELHGRLNLR